MTEEMTIARARRQAEAWDEIVDRNDPVAGEMLRTIEFLLHQTKAVPKPQKMDASDFGKIVS